MKKKKFIILTVAMLSVLICAVSVTFAWIIAMSNEVENTFTVGDVSISLDESTGTVYKLTPGTTLQKDPTVTVRAGSDSCWLFVKVDRSSNFDEFLSFSTEDGWTALSGESDVYYREVEATDTDVCFSVLKNDHIRVRDSVTEQQLAALDSNPAISFTAYAIQHSGISTAESAWNELLG